MTKREENHFLQSINRQDTEAYRELYNTYYRSLVMYAMHFVPQQDVAEDLVQELFINLWNKRMSFLSYPSFVTYLYSSIRNASLNYLKHLDVRQHYAEEVMESNQQPQEVETEIVNEEVFRRLYDAIERLPPKCREIFLMAMDGKKNEEIAHELDIAVGTVKTQKRRAISFLKDNAAESICLLFLLHPNVMG